MEHSGAGAAHSQATSSSVIVQSNQSEEGIALSSLSDIQQQHQQHHQSTQSQQTPQSSHLHRSFSIQQASSSSTTSPVLSPPGKTFGKNSNGTSE